ncbi:MAG: helix-hairpin-helix domain-containing protein, partial [Eudoraea sp.]|nr:helix-hairpin-helix domain-containing protein [Eudoraea sp.]
ISPNLRFPKAKKFSSGYKTTKKRTVVKADINIATASDLESIYGIGGVLSNRIIKFRNALGGFITVDQLYDVYGLEEEVVKNVVERYKIVDIPEIERISINESTVPELASLVYLSWDVAREIVAYRNSIGAYSQWEDLAQVSGFPFDKIERIKLYLTL